MNEERAGKMSGGAGDPAGKRGRRSRGDGSRATLRDVALHAGVSTATVSRAMNAPAAVSATLRERILAAMAALAFVPDQSARSLSSRHSRLIGVLAPALHDPASAGCVTGMEARLADAGYGLLLALTGGDARREEAAVAALAGRAVEAVIAVGQAPGAAALARLRDRGIPVAPRAGDEADATGANSGSGWWRAGHTLGQYLVGLGHVQCAWVTREDAATGRAAAVRAGAAAALAAAARPPLAEIVHGAGTTLRAALERPARRPTALVCADDALALAVLRELAALGIAVPLDASVTGCGDAPAARHAAPPLTTLRLAYEAAGAATADRVLAGLRGSPAPAVDVPVKLVIRGSSGPAA